MAIFNGYTGAKTCTTGPRSGAQGAMAWFLAAYKEHGAQNSGIYNCRNVRGSSRTNSLHGEWRAVDFGLKWASDIPAYDEFAEQLRLNSAELGIQCIIFNRKIFSGGYENKGWHRYSGVNPHTDHLHVEFSWGAARRGVADTVALWDKELRGKVTGNVKPTAGTPKPTVSKFPTDYKDVAVDGIWGKGSVKAFQILMRAVGHYNRAVDGDFGYYTIVALQKWLRGLGYYPSSKYVIDGKAGKATYKALQSFLAKKGHLDTKRWLIDGKFGKETIKAFQRYQNTQNGK
ncbi:peptidoglycan-binding domain-containing protein [Paeniglutamicibacter gangotriensis]|uniref:Putative Peptidoglycan domain protein n=1 Tax=Paeniglutamicibacter gangotriensis Lz1y TaxID=1276920 RepID=M7N979_9MICC|nr:peptidoglycan-binding domain-containing protein [Paeniglutamicibacter gangotriensis]EMQ98329.1 putative Peptidoglycan domain protein [Paeniglutamicibacter gangotriensis Lz1y]